MTKFTPVCKVNEVAEGCSRLCVVDEVQIAVFRVDGEYYALRNECPHAGASLAHGTLEGDVVRCRIHHWGFCVRDGRYVDQDLAQFNATKLTVRVLGEDIEVDTHNLSCGADDNSDKRDSSNGDPFG